MWSRSELKQRAKDVLRRTYWKAFLVSIVLVLAGGDGRSGGSGGGRNSGNNSSGLFSPGSFGIDSFTFAVVMITSVFVFLLLALALRVFIGYPLEVGGRRYFVKSALYTDNTRCFRFAFDGWNYLPIVLTMLLKGVQNFLWYLLLIIPGIVKKYAYSMVPYILADNPRVGYGRAIYLSDKMTYGHKLDIFVLELSFIGWYLLGLLALLIGVMFVWPYENATKAELYLVLRQNALDSGLCTYEELMLEEPMPE